jgi:hypothetical protein
MLCYLLALNREETPKRVRGQKYYVVSDKTKCEYECNKTASVV